MYPGGIKFHIDILSRSELRVKNNVIQELEKSPDKKWKSKELEMILGMFLDEIRKIRVLNAKQSLT